MAPSLHDVEPDWVDHLAAQVGLLFGEDDVVRTINSNALITALIARSCATPGVPSILAEQVDKNFWAIGRIPTRLNELEG